MEIWIRCVDPRIASGFVPGVGIVKWALAMDKDQRKYLIAVVGVARLDSRYDFHCNVCGFCSWR